MTTNTGWCLFVACGILTVLIALSSVASAPILAEMLPTPTPQNRQSDLFIQPHATASDHALQPSLTIDSVSAETVNVPFSIPRGIGVDSVQAYSGLITFIVSGVGQSSGTAFNDAFYIYKYVSFPASEPYHLDEFNLYIDGVSAASRIGYVPAYRSDHRYIFQLDVGSRPRRLNFAIGDANVSDNTGQFTVELQPAVVKPAILIVHGMQVLNMNVNEWSKYTCASQPDRFRESPSNSTLGEMPSWFQQSGYDVWFAHITSSPLHTPPIADNARCLKNQIGECLNSKR